MQPHDPTFPQFVQPPKRRKRLRWWHWTLIILGALLVLFIGLGLIGEAIGPPPQATASNPTPTPRVIQPTHVLVPTRRPVPTATRIPPTATVAIAPTATPVPPTGPAELGSPISTFITQYGQPNSHTDVANGSYHFQRIPGENTDGLIVVTDITDGNAYMQHVEDISVNAPASGWSMTQARTKCAVFFPRDAAYQRQVVTSSGTDQIYVSSSLAALFPASSFVDAKQNTVKAGTFDVLYYTSTAGSVSGCEMLIGEQQTI